ncbi:MAG TPA: class I SAM-dependent methyltransferase [Asanoa sp.]
MPDSLPFDRVADCYDATRGGDERGHAFADVLQPWLAPGRTLEVGVGTGLVAGALRARGLDVYGIDLAPAMLARAYGRLGPRVAVGDARRLPVRAGSCDTVTFPASLHVIRDTAAALAEAVRVLRPGGRVVVMGATAVDPADDELAPVLAGLPADDRADRPATVATAAAALGLRLVESREAHITELATSPNALADDIEQRIWSQLWHVDGVVWSQVVVPVIDRLRALPDPDQPRERPMFMHLSVFDR